VWLAGRIVCNSRACPASNVLRGHESLQSSRPRDFIREATHFRRVPSKQGPPTRIFSQFLVFRIGLPEMHAESGVFSRTEGHTVVRIRAPTQNGPKGLVIPNSFIVRNLLLGLVGSSPVPAPRIPDVEIIWKSCGMQ
jgi:hypothetical protein